MMTLQVTAEEFMQKARRAGIQVAWDRAFIPISLLILFVLRYTFRAPIWLLVAFCAWMPAYYIIYPMTLNSKWTTFEKEFARRFQKGEHKQLLDFYMSQWFLRRFGPRADMMGKLGLIYSALERYREAEEVLERAVDIAPGGLRERLFFNLANVKFELGKHQDAEQIYRTLKPNSPYRRAAQTQMALIDMHRGHRVEDARKILEAERGRASGQLKSRIETALAGLS
jgi:tetratricopeptide (TPR) repeat protein